MRPIAPPKPNLHVVVRDPKRTRERILTAALKEFSTKGLAGARVDRIARRARINKRMLYHYFGHKDDLFREILRRKLEERVAWAAAAPDDPGETLTHWFKLACEDVDWVRLIEWEALAVGDGPLLSEAERRRAFASGVDKLRAVQAKGLLPRDLDPRQPLARDAGAHHVPAGFPAGDSPRDGAEPPGPGVPEAQDRVPAPLRAVLGAGARGEPSRGAAGHGGRR